MHLLESKIPKAAMLQDEEPEVGVASMATRDVAGEAGSRHLDRIFNHGPRHLRSLYGREGQICSWVLNDNGCSAYGSSVVVAFSVKVVSSQTEPF